MSMPGEPIVTDAPPAGEPPPAAPPAELDLDTPLDETRSYTAAEMKAVRAEAAARRVEARDLKARFDAQFEGLEDQSDFNYLLDMARKLNTDPDASLKDIKDLAERLERDLNKGKPLPPVPPAADDKNKPLTVADLERIEYEREVARQTALIVSEARSLSDDSYKFEDGNEEYARLLWIAQNDKEAAKAPNRLEAAAAKIRAHDEAVGKAAVAAYVESVRAGGAAFPPASAPAGGAPAAAPGAGPPKNFKDASASAMERLIRGTA